MEAPNFRASAYYLAGIQGHEKRAQETLKLLEQVYNQGKASILPHKKPVSKKIEEKAK